MNWFAAMICTLPLLAVGSPVRFLGVRMPWGQKARTWVALFGASIAAWLVKLDNPASAYAVIDALAAYLVLRKPLGEMQRAIGVLFIGMLGIDVGFASACWLQPGPHDYGGYTAFNQLMGWLQWACLASWGGGDALASRLIFNRRGSSYPLSGRDGA